MIEPKPKLGRLPEDYNIPPLEIYKTYVFNIPIIDKPLYLCVEHNGIDHLVCNSCELTNDKPGFDYLPIDTSGKTFVTVKGNVVNMYFSYTRGTPRQFY